MSENPIEVPKPITKTKRAVFYAVTIIIVLLVAEILARLILNNNGAISIAERKNRFEPYQNKPWTGQYFKDEADCGAQRRQFSATSSFARYIVYDVGYPECRTETINYIEGDKRKTWNPDYASSSAEVVHIAVFGGSTVQGVGVPDDYTIPSFLSQLLNAPTSSGEVARRPVYEVTNYGVSGYTYTQAVLKFAMLLREGKPIDYAIFYHGANDVDNAYEAGEVGAFFDEKTVRDRIYGGLWGQAKGALKNQISACGLCRLVVTISRHTPVLKDHLTPFLVKVRRASLFKEGASKPENDIPPFAKGIADNYMKSHGFLDKLSQAYRVPYAEFWQPSLMVEDALVGGEKSYLDIDNRLTDEKLKKLYRLTLENVVHADMANFYDLSQALVGRPKAYYLDAVHISDEGNRAVAEKIVGTIHGKLPR